MRIHLKRHSGEKLKTIAKRCKTCCHREEREENLRIHLKNRKKLQIVAKLVVREERSPCQMFTVPVDYLFLARCLILHHKVLID